MQSAMTTSGGLEAFKTALRRFVREVCEALSQVDVSRRLWTRIVREEDGRVAFRQEERRDLTRLLHGLLVTLHTNPTEMLQQTIDAVRGDPRLAATLLVDGGGNPIVEENAQTWWATNQLAGAFLRAYFARTMEPVFDESAFDAVFSQFVTELESPVVAVTELSPLINARLDCDRIDIVPGLAIWKLSVDELEEWLNEYMEFPFMLMHGLSPIDPSSLDCAIEVMYEKGRHEAWGLRREIGERVSDLMTVLRLLSDQNVHMAFTKRTSSSILQPRGGTSSSIRPRLRGTEARVSCSMRQEIVDTWHRIQALPINSPIRLALRRWDIVSERFNEDDALIDYWIALESLFAPESFQEVRYRASLRIAAYAGETSAERTHMYEDLKASYALRSRIVHGSVPETKRKSDLIGRTRSYLRRALLKALSSNETFDPESIETNLLRN